MLEERTRRQTQKPPTCREDIPRSSPRSHAQPYDTTVHRCPLSAAQQLHFLLSAQLRPLLAHQYTYLDASYHPPGLTLQSTNLGNPKHLSERSHKNAHFPCSNRWYPPRHAIYTGRQSPFQHHRCYHCRLFNHRHNYTLDRPNVGQTTWSMNAFLLDEHALTREKYFVGEEFSVGA